MVIIDKQFRDVTFFVLCGGKCGSTTLQYTLNNYGKTMHIHSHEDFVQRYHITNYTIFDIIKINSKTHPVYIIDSYRTPIERKISSFFNNITTHLPNYKKHKLRSIIKYFNAGYIYRIEEYHPIDIAMDYFGVEKFSSFDFENKYNIRSKNNITFIKLRFQDISLWSEILSKILDKNIVINKQNLSDTKDYNKLYVKFKKYYYIPELYLNNFLLNDNQFKIYNTEKEQETYINEWKQRLLKIE
jgi:hypothetical protein